MQSLSRVAGSPDQLGEPLPPVFTSLEYAGIKFRRSQLTMIAAQPNGMKSAFVLSYILQLKKLALVFSADNDEWETIKRSAAIITNRDQGAIEKEFVEASEWYQEVFSNEVDDFLRFSFETDPTYEDFVLETLAFQETFGDFPALIVVDNLMNVSSDSEEEHRGLQEVLKFLKRLARKTGAAVIVLHHMQESERINPYRPPPRSALQQKLSQTPETILSLCYLSRNQQLLVSPVKNRGGPSDPKAETWVTLGAVGATMHIFDIPEGFR